MSMDLEHEDLYRQVVPKSGYLLTSSFYHINPHSRSHLASLEINGCFKASCGVHLFSGLSARHRSSRSANKFSSFVSTSVKPLVADIRRVRRSREGLAKAKVFMTSYESKAVSEIFYYLNSYISKTRERGGIGVSRQKRKVKQDGTSATR